MVSRSTTSELPFAELPATVVELDRARVQKQVRAAGDGDVRAQRWLIEAVIGDVRGVARALVREVHEVDDAAQFALLQVLKAAAGFRGEASLRHWARCVATRAVLKHRARQRRHLVWEGDADLLEAIDVDVPDHPEEQLPRSLREYLAELPIEQAEALVLHHALGYSIAEIAEIAELSPNTIKSRIRLATRELRRRIRQDLLIGRRPSRQEVER
ncbi:MAG TPA: RNA polymerase sigma factor [Enhygromyxa sp.]|nr:RNA polymerase sigma factor [Enhygromyxa sp.]